MQDFGEVRSRWDQCLAHYNVEKSDIEAQIGTIRETMGEEKSPLPGSFLSRLKSRVSQGVEVLKAKKQVRDLERRLSAAKGNVGAEATRTREQLLAVALASDVKVGAKVEFARMPASSKALGDLRQQVGAVTEDLEQAAKAQDFAYSVKDSASTLQAYDAAQKAVGSLNRLSVRLMQPPSELTGSAQLNSFGLSSNLNITTFTQNQAGKGQWLNSEMAKSMRSAISELRDLDKNIGTSLKSIDDRRTSLSQEVIAAACLADADFGKLHKSVESWL